ncbi:hypothetical protein VULLAG_LOCUS16933 [Vulpes lagopus]
MSCKPGDKPEAKKSPGMAECSEGLEVARAEGKASKEATGKGKGGLFCLPTMDEDLEGETWRTYLP